MTGRNGSTDTGLKTSGINLNVVFWDYPKFRDEKYLKNYLIKNRKKEAYYWVMGRFAEYGRVVDTLALFSIEDISTNLGKLKISEYSLKKWKRLIEVYE